MVVETDWPDACSGVSLSEPSIAVSTAGQTTFVGKIRDVLSSLSGGHGLGIIYWEPGWVGNANLGSPCSVSAMVPWFRPDNVLTQHLGCTSCRWFWKHAQQYLTILIFDVKCFKFKSI